MKAEKGFPFERGMVCAPRVARATASAGVLEREGERWGLSRPEEPVESRLQVASALQFTGWCRDARLACAVFGVRVFPSRESEYKRKRDREAKRERTG